MDRWMIVNLYFFCGETLPDVHFGHQKTSVISTCCVSQIFAWKILDLEENYWGSLITSYPEKKFILDAQFKTIRLAQSAQQRDIAV